MDELAEQLRKASEAVKGLPSELRAVAFQFVLQSLPHGSQRKPKPKAGRTEKRAAAKGTAKTKRVASSSPPSVVKLPVSKPELEKYVAKKQPGDHLERYAVMAACLREKAIERVGVDEIYTCYRHLNLKAPKVMRQVFHNARNTKGWFDEADSDGKFGLTHVGVQFVEHDLPAQPTGKP